MQPSGLTPALPNGAIRACLFLCSRLLCGAVLVLTSAYCILAYIPFAYFGFLHPPLIPWVGNFARLHGYFYCAVFLAVSLDLVSGLRNPKIRTSLVAFVLLNLIFGVNEIFHHGLTDLSPNSFSYLWAVLALFPLLWLTAIDVAGSDTEDAFATRATRATAELNVSTALLAASVVAIAFGVTALFRELRNGGRLSLADVAAAFAASIVLHWLIFGVFAVLLQLLRAAGEKTPWPARAQFILPRILVATIVALVLRSIAFPSISFEGIWADVFCVVIAAVLIAYVSVVSFRFRALLGPRKLLRVPGVPSKYLLAAAAGVLGGLAYSIPVFLGPTDWDFVLQRAAVLSVWTATLGFLRWSGLKLEGRAPKVWLVAVLILALAGFAPHKLQAAPDWTDWGDTLNRYAGWDLSFKTAYTIVSRSVHNDAYTGFYQFLKQNTNLRQPVGPANLDLVNDLRPSSGKKPNIFLFVIDSLRQDYLSPYNSSVGFTPQIGRFAQDSVVFRNAFTRYAGTAISEPAIWAGALLPHKQFVKPFYPVNNLQHLIDAEGYQSYISVDPILQQILRVTPSITQLDEGTRQMSDYDYAIAMKGADARSITRTKQNTKSWSNLDFVDTLSELESKIDARAGSTKPMFVYTQPQNVHTLTLEQSRTGGTRSEITATELRRMDVAFGQFIEFLKARGLYDDSIIIITADHGDAFGEFGRFGHSDFLFPEVIRIPLIIHLPSTWRQRLVCDTQKIAFSIDITPSLYYILGHPQTLISDLVGRPLFTHSLQEQDPYLRPEYFIASSYAPVYGILGGQGDTLFIVDAVNQQNYFYNLSSDPGGLHNVVTPKIRDANEQLIRRQILSIAGAYGVKAD